MEFQSTQCWLNCETFTIIQWSRSALLQASQGRTKVVFYLLSIYLLCEDTSWMGGLLSTVFPGPWGLQLAAPVAAAPAVSLRFPSSSSCLLWGHAIFLHEQSFSEKPSACRSSDLFLVWSVLTEFADGLITLTHVQFVSLYILYNSVY